jgi:EAL domain-containing protein (putative c-di-GMP-specific phosphodiesterase class I)
VLPSVNSGLRVNSLTLYPSYLDSSQVPPEKLCFEVSEAAAIARLAIAKEFIARLKVRDCQFSQDR